MPDRHPALLTTCLATLNRKGNHSMSRNGLTNAANTANPRGRHRPGPGRIDVLCLGVVLANGHTRHRAADSFPTQNEGAA